MIGALLGGFLGTLATALIGWSLWPHPPGPTEWGLILWSYMLGAIIGAAIERLVRA